MSECRFSLKNGSILLFQELDAKVNEYATARWLELPSFSHPNQLLKQHDNHNLIEEQLNYVSMNDLGLTCFQIDMAT